MANTKCSQCRRAGQKLFLRGEKCQGPKCPLLKRKYAPGQHGPTQRGGSKTAYGKQLREKQSAKQLYGLREKQFVRYVEEATRKTGNTGDLLLSALESRLDNAVYRTGLAPSRAGARQVVNHGHITVNGKKVDIPSYKVRIGEEISLTESSKKKPLFAEIIERLSKVEAPAWLNIEPKNIKAKILNTPSLENPPFSVKAIIEFYSR